MTADSRLPPLELVGAGTPAPERTYWVVFPWLLAGAYPGDATPDKHAARIKKIRATGRATFVNLVEERARNNQGVSFASYVEALDALESGLPPAACLRFPVVDGDIPSSAMMRSILDAIDVSLEARRPVYVHCFGGMGRTATVVGCWLLRHGLASKANVLETITRLRRPDKLRADEPAPENAKQREFVLIWGD